MIYQSFMLFFQDVFHLQRTHMLARHAKEQEHVKRINQENEENMLRALTADRKALPKVLRGESKTRTMMFRKSLEVDLPVILLHNFQLYDMHLRVKVTKHGQRRLKHSKRRRNREYARRWRNTI